MHSWEEEMWGVTHFASNVSSLRAPLVVEAALDSESPRMAAIPSLGTPAAYGSNFPLSAMSFSAIPERKVLVR